MPKDTAELMTGATAGACVMRSGYPRALRAARPQAYSQAMTDTHTIELTYAQLEEQFSSIGGVHGLLLMLPALMPELDAATIDAIAKGVDEQMPVDVTAVLPAWTVHIRLRA